MKNIKDAVWGFVVGDSLGVPYEFSTRSMMKFNPAVDMVGYGTYNQPPGTWSDDTSMMLCVLENIINNGNINTLSDLFIRWFRDDYMTPHGELFDIGLTTSEALQRVLIGVKPGLSGSEDEFSAGNGSLMRSLPYAFVEDINLSIYNMNRENKITHRNLICSYCCMFYVMMMRAILDGNDKSEAYQAGAAYIKFVGEKTNENDNKVAELNLFNRLFSSDFTNLPELEIKSTGYVLTTLEACIWCFLNTDNYKDAVLKAVNLGGDTDTIAALTGGLAGLYYGYKTIPTDWLSKIAGQHLINNLLNEINPNAAYIQRI